MSAAEPPVGLDEIREDFRRALTVAFCNALSGSRLPPMTVLAAGASALRAVYDEVAEAHAEPGGCPCGWRPIPAADIAMLAAAIEGSLRAAEIVDLRFARTLGRG